MGNSLQGDSAVATADSLAIANTAISHGAQQKPNELAAFLDLLSAINPEVVVEIGVHAGGTLYAWKQYASTVFGIDLMPSGPEPVYCISGHPRREWGATVIVGDSHDAKTFAALAEHLHGRAIDCLFIDGDHSYDGVRQDYEMYAPLVREGGLIGFHDIASWCMDDIGVDRFWAEVKDDSAVEIIDDYEGPRFEWPRGRGFGIGALKI